jgi:hypothetical protein
VLLSNSFGHTLLNNPLKETISTLLRNDHLRTNLYALTFRRACTPYPWTMHRYPPLSLLLPYHVQVLFCLRARFHFKFGDAIVFWFFGASESGGSKVYKAAHFSPSISLQNSFYITLKWIPSPTSPPLKFPPTTRVEVQEATLTVLLRNPRPLRPPPTWTAEDPVAMLTALLPKWRIRLVISSTFSSIVLFY